MIILIQKNTMWRAGQSLPWDDYGRSLGCPVSPFDSAQGDSVFGSAQGDSVFGSAQGDSVFGSTQGDSVFNSAQGDSVFGNLA